MIGHKVEHQSQSALAEPIAQPSQRRITAEILRYGVPGDRESRPANILIAQVRQCLLKFAPPFWIAPRDILARESCLPNTPEPDPVKTELRKAIQIGIWNIVKRGAAAEFPGQLSQPNSCIDLV